MTEELTITALAHGGAGLGRKDGKVVFVPYALPGERILFETLQEKKRHSWGRLIRVLDPAAHRRPDPPCPYFGDCGGCHWQHIRDADQAGHKERLFSEMLHRQGGVDPSCIRPIEGSPKSFGYRTSLTLKVRQGRVGFFGARSHRLVPVERCLLAPDVTNHVLETLGKDLYRAALTGNVSELVISAAPDQASVQVCLLMSSPLKPSLGDRLVRLFEDITEIKSLAWLCERQSDSGLLFPHSEAEGRLSFPLPARGTAPRHLLVSPGVFLQANWDVNLIMIREVLDSLARIGNHLRVLELFSGAGNFTIPMALDGHTVDAYEIHAPAVADAALNVRRYGLKNARVLCMAANRALASLSATGESYDVLVADPPRSGMKEEVGRVAALKVPHLLVISCEPAALCRDLNVLRESGYRLEWSLPLDMFPQTYHVESINYLKMSGA